MLEHIFFCWYNYSKIVLMFSKIASFGLKPSSLRAIFSFLIYTTVGIEVIPNKLANSPASSTSTLTKVTFSEFHPRYSPTITES